MSERDCNTCANHVQGASVDDVPKDCWGCCSAEMNTHGLIVLPLWKPLEFVNAAPTAAGIHQWEQEVAADAGFHLAAKDTNPKDAIGSKKLPLNLVPDSLEVYAATAFLEGALKYGACNWRVAGVRSSIYMAAHKRHVKKYWNGETYDPKTKVHHLASAIACLAIVLDAELCDKLTDDRPPKADVGGLIDGLEGTVVHLQELFKDHHPKHHTING